MKKNIKAFTLIEFMIVIAILGIVAAVAIPAYDNYKNKQDINYVSDNGSSRSNVLINELFDEVSDYKDSCDFYDDSGYYNNGDFFICSVKFKHIEKLNDSYHKKNETLSIRCPDIENKKCYIN